MILEEYIVMVVIIVYTILLNQVDKVEMVVLAAPVAKVEPEV